MTVNESEVEQYVIDMISLLSVMQRHGLSDLLCKYYDVLNTKPGTAKVEGYVIKVIPDFSPKRLRPYRILIALQNEIDLQIQELLELGVIEQSDSERAKPLLCVAKKDGSVYLWVDFRLLNTFTILDVYQMKHANASLYKIGEAQIINVLDLTKIYWQIPKRKECTHYTAYLNHSGHYQWRVMPGLKNADSTFQKLIDKVLIPN